ncbi:hypothetical protein HCB18_24700 [Salinispora arenicola]|nr:hypothetical protein [Salinispora arenicola]NIL64338.1 hypothetical protein [Salinispora arenicola]
MTSRPMRPPPVLPPLPRLSAPLDTHVAYHVPMDSEHRIDRAEWAAVVREVLETETGGKKEPLARLLKINSKTLNRWLGEEVDVSEEYVRLVARTTGRDPMGLLTRVGYYQPADLTGRPAPTQQEIAEDAALRAIEESGHPPRVKARMRERLHELRRQRKAAEVEEVQWWIDHAKEA